MSNVVSRAVEPHRCSGVTLAAAAGTTTAELRQWEALLLAAGLSTTSTRKGGELVLRGLEDTEGRAPGALEQAGAHQPSVLHVACAANGSRALAMDLGAEVAALVLHEPPPERCELRLAIPARIGSFSPVLVAAQRGHGSPGAAAPRLSAGVPQLGALTGQLPTQAEGLAQGRIALELVWDGRLLDGFEADARRRWTQRLLHQLSGRWIGVPCACCS